MFVFMKNKLIRTFLSISQYTYTWFTDEDPWRDKAKKEILKM